MHVSMVLMTASPNGTLTYGEEGQKFWGRGWGQYTELKRVNLFGDCLNNPW